MQAQPTNSPDPKKHYVYLLRCWQEADGEWRFAIEPVNERQQARRGFPNLTQLLRYLEQNLPQNRDPKGDQ